VPQVQECLQQKLESALDNAENLGETLPGLKAHSYALLRQIGYRGAVLLVFGLVDLVYALSFAFPTTEALASSTFQWLILFLPIPAWVAIWASVGLICFFFAFRTIDDAIGYATAILIKVFWAGLFLWGWALGELMRGYLSAVIWAGFAFFLWLESRRPETAGREQ
jgi:hypothetical protein